MWSMADRDQLSRAMAGCCALFWLVGSLSLGQGSFAEQWTKPHCPSGHAQHSHQTPHHCVWHCDGIDQQAVGGQRGSPTKLAVRNVWNGFAAFEHVTGFHAQRIPRGPPSFWL